MTDMDSFRYHSQLLDSVIVGEPAATALADLVTHYDAHTIFLIASRSLHEQSDVVSALAAALPNTNVCVHTGIRAHTPRADVLEAINIAAAQPTDLIVTVGGGSIIDAGKIVQLALHAGITTEAELLTYAQFADGSRGPKAGTSFFTTGDAANSATHSATYSGMAAEKKVIRHIAIPTTLAGAEFSTSASALDEQQGVKEGYKAADLCPRAVILDPALSVHTPLELWLSTAIRALDHAVEGYCAKAVYPYLEAQFLHAMALFARSLPMTKADPSDLRARNLNQQATWLACAGLGRVKHGASHGIGYALGSLCGIPHGYTSCVLLPAVLEWNAAVNQERQNAIAAALGVPHTAAAETIKRLIQDLDLPVSLRELGVPQTFLPDIAKAAANHSVVRANPRSIQSADDVMEILERAW